MWWFIDALAFVRAENALGNSANGDDRLGIGGQCRNDGLGQVAYVQALDLVFDATPVS